MKTSIKIIEQAVSEQWIKPLALFHLCKFNFGNSVIYNYQKRMDELAGRSYVSTKTLYTYLAALKNRGLIEDKGNSQNLHLTSIKSIKYDLNDIKKCKIIISPDDNLYIIQNKLYAKLIENQFKKMAFKKAIKEFGRRDLSKLRSGETAAAPFSLSIRNMAKLLNISNNTVPKVLKTLEGLKILKTWTQKPVKISDGKLDVGLVDDYPGYKFVTDNGTFIQFGFKIELLQYPIKIPKISYKVYIKYYKSTHCKN